MNGTAQVSKSTLTLAAFALFFLSFLMSGNGNALPQVFFQRYYPEQKMLLLSIALLSSTVAAVMGVLLSSRVHARRMGVAISILVTTTIAEALLSASGAVPFIICLVLVQFADNFLLNQIDHAAVGRSGALRGFNDGAGNAARLFGMLCAPAFFTAFADHEVVEKIVIAVLGNTAMFGCLRLFQLNPRAEIKSQFFAEPAVPNLADWLVFGYAIAVYVALYLFAANMIYLLGDIFHIADAQTRGGVAIVTVFLFAVIANGVKSKCSPKETGSLRPAALALPAVVLIFAAGFILFKIQADYAVCLVVSALIGASYGIFLWEIRAYSSLAAKQGKMALLSWFNNMANISSLFAFGLMLALASGRAPGSYYTGLMYAVVGVQVVGLMLLFIVEIQVRRTKLE